VSAALSLALWLAAAPATLVLPPETARDSVEAVWVSEAVSDLLPGALNFLGVPAVEREDRLLAYEELYIPPVSLTRATSLRVAQALGTTRVVFGRSTLQRGSLELSLRVLDTTRGTLSLPFVASGGLESLLELVDTLAWDIALASSAPQGRTRADLRARHADISWEALSAYGQGLALAEPRARMSALARCLALAPRFDEARLALARLQMDERDWNAAIDTLAPLNAPELARAARFSKGRCLLELGRYREAGAGYAGLVGAEPSPAVLNNHALALLRGPGGAVRASDVLRKALDANPRDPDIAFNLSWALLSEGDAASATFWLQGLVQTNPSDAHARVVLSWALRRAGRVEEADEAWKAVLSLAASLSQLATPDLGRRFERILPSERRLEVGFGATSHGELATLHLSRAERALGTGDLDQAWNELARAAHLDPYNARAHALLARVHRERGEPDKAVAELRMSLVCRDDPAVRVELAELLRDLGRDGEARTEAERVLKSDPSNQAAKRLLIR
jgi:tetratricopeptide (TPR) repeat protein